MARFRPAPGLDAAVARLVASAVGQVAEQVADQAAEFAPPVKVWRTRLDERVRPWHRSAEGQAVPGNLRFELEHSPRQHNPHPPGHELLREPRDPTAYYLQIDDCRCRMDHNDELARSIHAGEPFVAGTRVSAPVSTRYPRAAESEFGTDEDAPARFMGRAAAAVGAKL
jgi:hypothetical protein